MKRWMAVILTVFIAMTVSGCGWYPAGLSAARFGRLTQRRLAAAQRAAGDYGAVFSPSGTVRQSGENFEMQYTAWYAGSRVTLVFAKWGDWAKYRLEVERAQAGEASTGLTDMGEFLCDLTNAVSGLYIRPAALRGFLEAPDADYAPEACGFDSDGSGEVVSQKARIIDRWVIFYEYSWRYEARRERETGAASVAETLEMTGLLR